ncbi:RING-H2 finger protein ATL64-like [Phragmites australis]|uniref:RING-H2 finger protein ATL64-like n=1 Tax=Phragmites australis TaxID=29695 RepID=UPI002D79DAE3|nr:RING-H2 finger protein ATL64-like [Phragmites australis]
MEETSPSAAAAGGVIRCTPHGRLLTGCLVALNVFVVLLVYVYFWRFFSRARGDGAPFADHASSSAASSPPASPKARDRWEVERAITALPIFVHSSSSDHGAAAAAECAICIAEFADGEEGRLLPRCGHRFHARCVDLWFRLHTTCPLCRATVLVDVPADTAAAAAAASAEEHENQLTDRNTSADTDTDCPV